MSDSQSKAERQALRRVLEAKEAEHAAAIEDRRRKRDEVRSLDRRIQKLESHLLALHEMVSDSDPESGRKTVSVLRAGESLRDAEIEANLAGVPRVQAIEIILAEAGPNVLHRQEVCDRLRLRGFPGEQVGDTSAALAYLKRTGRAVNSARGYWRAA